VWTYGRGYGCAWGQPYLNEPAEFGVGGEVWGVGVREKGSAGERDPVRSTRYPVLKN